MISALVMLGALALDLALSWPAALYRRIGHPVTWIGAQITWAETRFNRGSHARRILAGAAVTALVVLSAALPMWLLQRSLPAGAAGLLLAAVLAWPWLALRSMYTHVAAVAEPLIAGDLIAARGAVAMIVGRDVTRLDTAGVARAACESLAENTSDGVVAPLFWGLLGGLPGLAAYKAINTLDSMIGHRSARYEAFGKTAARLDDVVNWIPARVTALLFALARPLRAARALGVVARDARAHRSPNAGWPESALAGALGVRLSGPRLYDTGAVAEPWLNGEAPDPGAQDLRRALRLYQTAMALAAGVLALVALAQVALAQVALAGGMT